MQKELKVRLLKAIYYVGFHTVFDTLPEQEDERLNELTRAYRKAYRELAEYAGYPDDMDLLEPESIM